MKLMIFTYTKPAKVKLRSNCPKAPKYIEVIKELQNQKKKKKANAKWF
jgi:hypothetical protein